MTTTRHGPRGDQSGAAAGRPARAGPGGVQRRRRPPRPTVVVERPPPAPSVHRGAARRARRPRGAAAAHGAGRGRGPARGRGGGHHAGLVRAAVRRGPGRSTPTSTTGSSRQAELPQASASRSSPRPRAPWWSLVENTPGLDPFRGLERGSRAPDVDAPGRRRRGWLVDGEPVVELRAPARRRGVGRGAALGRGGAGLRRGGRQRPSRPSPRCSGRASRPATLCGATGAVQGGRWCRCRPGAAATELVAQYTADVDLWARAVSITAPVRITVIMAPIGDVVARWSRSRTATVDRDGCGRASVRSRPTVPYEGTAGRWGGRS